MTSQPLYKEIVQTIIDQILASVFLENQKLPSKRQLALTYNVSRFTIHSALEYLEKENYIYTLHGSGSFIAPKLVPINLNSFYSFDIETSKYDGPITNKILVCEIVPSTPYLSHRMQLPLTMKLYKIMRLRYSYKTPIFLQTTYLPQDIVPYIDEKKLVHTPLYQYLATHYDLQFHMGKEYIQAYLPTVKERTYLQVIEQVPCLKIERMTMDQSRIIEYTETVTHGDKYSFEIDLKL